MSRKKNTPSQKPDASLGRKWRHDYSESDLAMLEAREELKNELERVGAKNLKVYVGTWRALGGPGTVIVLEEGSKLLCKHATPRGLLAWLKAKSAEPWTAPVVIEGELPPLASRNETQEPAGSLLYGQLRNPTAKPSDAFYPYLKKALRGELEKLFEFCKFERWGDGTPEPAFCECVGFLALSVAPKHRKLADRIIKLDRRTSADRFNTTGAKLSQARYVVRQLNTLASDAAAWLQKRRKVAALKVPAEALWSAYLQDKNATESDAKAAAALESPIRIVEAHKKVGSYKAKTVRVEGPICIRGLSCGIVPERLFFILAQSRVSPSHALRKYAAEIARVSESLVAQRHPRTLLTP